MLPFIDLEGASGRIYRFRLWREGEAHQPIAGNYAYVRQASSGMEILGLGATNDLSAARQPLKGRKQLEGAAIYTRLNVPRGARENEHQDLVAHHKPAFVGVENA